MKRIIIACLISCIFFGASGYFLGFINGSATLAQSDLPGGADEKLNLLKIKFEELSKVDLQEYLALKENRKKYEKADEILGKILLIMLYDLGIRSSEYQVQQIKSQIIVPTENDSSPMPPEVPTLDRVENAQTVPLKGETNKTLTVYEAASVKDVLTENDMKDFLAKSEISDLFKHLQAGGKLSESQLELINGHFYGEATFDDSKKASWQVEMQINARLEKGEYKGTHDIKLIKEGKQISHSSGGFRDDDYQSIRGSQAIIINAYGDDGYFQLYYFPQLRQFSGLVYMKEGLGKFKKSGVVRLTKEE